MTALRLYLSAQTPQSGTSGQADDEDQRAEEPDEGEAIGLVDAHLAEVGGQQREDLATPMLSTRLVTQNTATGIRQSCAGRASVRDPVKGRSGTTEA